MSEDPPDVSIPEAGLNIPEEFPQYLGPPSPDDQELAKKVSRNPKTRWNIAHALFQNGSGERAIARVEQDHLNAEIEELKFDPLTDLLNRGPGEKQAHELIGKVISGEHDAPTALMLLMVDVIDLHGTNEAHGHHAGDNVISSTAEKVEEVANELNSSLRTHDRRSLSTEAASEEQRQSDRRHGRYKDIIWRRGGDEFVAVVALYESDTATKDLVRDIITGRIDADKARWGTAFYDPISNPELAHKDVLKYLEKLADPKGNGQSSRGAKAA